MLEHLYPSIIRYRTYCRNLNLINILELSEIQFLEKKKSHGVFGIFNRVFCVGVCWGVCGVCVCVWVGGWVGVWGCVCGCVGGVCVGGCV